VDVLVPDLGDFADVEVIEVLVKPGDVVGKEDSLITLETEKATTDIPSPASGRVSAVKVKVGSTVSTGDLIVVLEESAGESASAPGDGRPEDDRTVRQPRPAAAAEVAVSAAVETPTPAPRSAAPDAAPHPAPTARVAGTIDETGFSLAHASPSVRKLARELGVDLGRIRGSGRKGRVTPDDVKGFVKEIMRGGLPTQGPALPQVPHVDFAKFGAIELQPLTRIQKISGPRLHASWVNVPHVTQHDEADITNLEKARVELKVKAAERGIRLTPLAFVLRACVLVLAEFPAFRSSISDDGESLVIKKYMHLGFAADTPQGLVVPVIRDADKMDVYELAKALADSSERAREGKLKTDDIQGGVFTVSSLGGIGGSFFTPIINAPEVAILGVSKSQLKPIFDGEKFVPRLMLPLSLSYDHRVIDGAQAARFITRLSAILGETERLIEATP
jgi:pyruvate dehydrogenase E2 component (dihydrolipoamide acetyltransferase)